VPDRCDLGPGAATGVAKTMGDTSVNERWRAMAQVALQTGNVLAAVSFSRNPLRRRSDRMAQESTSGIAMSGACPYPKPKVRADWQAPDDTTRERTLEVGVGEPVGTRVRCGRSRTLW